MADRLNFIIVFILVIEHLAEQTLRLGSAVVVQVLSGQKIEPDALLLFGGKRGILPEHHRHIGRIGKRGRDFKRICACGKTEGE